MKLQDEEIREKLRGLDIPPVQVVLLEECISAARATSMKNRRKCINMVGLKCGFDDESFEALKVKISSKAAFQHRGMLIFDEIQVWKEMYVNSKTMTYAGLVNHGEGISQKDELADHGFVFAFAPFGFVTRKLSKEASCATCKQALEGKSGVFSAPEADLVNCKMRKHQYERKTMNLQLSYYVKENFMAEHKSNIYRIEMDVEADHIANLRSSCFREKNYKESLLWRAKSLRDASLEERALDYQMPSCDRLAQLSRMRV
ncbi:hypothetical protein HPB50_022404 [Hyalomma asiaticum]|uniref:Uncharacterized protein n=1 Tax=Hyalomma asiaticum TaxID=266040 RepID=A0ACB7TPE0_HYAAI|nr:hypothetical protein HPB50_022404 [Hyalomma asiaticum]